MLRTCLFLVFCGVGACLCAQTWTVSGVVRSDSGEPLAGATVYADGQGSVAADADGRFVLRCPGPPAGVTARYTGYFSQRVRLSETDFQGRRAEAVFSLTPQNPVLGEVTVSSKPIETVVTTDFSRDLFDFGFAGDRLLLLLRDKKRYILRLQTENGELLSEIELPGEPQVLHRSCLGDFHVVSAQQAWEISLAQDRLDTLPAYPTENFKRFIEPCALQAGGYYFFLQRKKLNQHLRYLSFRENEGVRVLCDIGDAERMAYAGSAVNDFLANAPMIFRTPAHRFSRMGNPLELMEPETFETDFNSIESLLPYACHECYDQLHRLAELETIRRDSAYAPMFRFDDTVALFDHVNGRLIRFQPDSPAREIVRIDYFRENGWAKLLLKDEVSGRLYARFDKKSGLLLKEIDPKTGQIIGLFDLSLAPYLSEKWKIRNGILYFLGQPDVNVPNMMLYKMNIFAGKRMAKR